MRNGQAGESAGSAAWKLLGAEAWRLLGTGRLRAAAQLTAALSAIGGSVPALLLFCKPSDLPQPTPASIAKGMHADSLLGASFVMHLAESRAIRMTMATEHYCRTAIVLRAILCHQTLSSGISC